MNELIRHYGANGLEMLPPTEPICYINPDFGGKPALFWEHDCVQEGKDAFHSRGILRSDKYGRLDAPSPEWTIVSEEPLTVSPSILCLACNTHGFFTDGVWLSV